MRKTLIFGNGLGMALDPVHFSLPHALNEVWNSNAIDQTHKQLISACLPHQNGNCPQGEEELDKLHVAISSCEYLGAIPGVQSYHWLSEYGWNFPNVCRSFISRVATRLYDFNGSLPERFCTPLSDFIRQTKSHVATLNYDKLLYDFFIKDEIVCGFNGKLVDGITKAGFSNSNLDRLFGNDFGYYLHLHGSPLFRDREGRIRKLSRFELSPEQPEPSSHIVLTHIQHKLAVISSSAILSAYWQRLYFSLSESEEVILFGYSGLDEHLNELLSIYSMNLRFRVVEWTGSGLFQQRQAFWNSILRNNVKLIQVDNILDFAQWY